MDGAPVGWVATAGPTAHEGDVEPRSPFGSARSLTGSPSRSSKPAAISAWVRRLDTPDSSRTLGLPTSAGGYLAISTPPPMPTAVQGARPGGAVHRRDRSAMMGDRRTGRVRRRAQRLSPFVENWPLRSATQCTRRGAMERSPMSSTPIGLSGRRSPVSISLGRLVGAYARRSPCCFGRGRTIHARMSSVISRH